MSELINKIETAMQDIDNLRAYNPSELFFKCIIEIESLQAQLKESLTRESETLRQKHEATDYLESQLKESEERRKAYGKAIRKRCSDIYLDNVDSQDQEAIYNAIDNANLAE